MKHKNSSRRHNSSCTNYCTCSSVSFPPESVLVETEEPVSVEAFKAACEKFPVLQVKDNPAEQIYPMPLYTSNQNDCEIGRIRKDLYNDKGMNFWIVGDQIRKGAALNAL